jgi:hypothetical protein
VVTKFGSFSVVGEWWMADTEAILSQSLQTGGAPNVSDAYTINGLPGPLYNCSAQGTLLDLRANTQIVLLIIIRHSMTC